jgi:hypothetical protein
LRLRLAWDLALGGVRLDAVGLDLLLADLLADLLLVGGGLDNPSCRLETDDLGGWQRRWLPGTYWMRRVWPSTGDVPRRGVRVWCRAGQRRGVDAGRSWAGVTSLMVAVSKAMEPSER